MLFRFFPLKNIIRLQSSRSLSTSNNSESVPINSILKVYATIGSPNYAQPWQSKPLKDVTGSGFVIDGRRILTNAHVVADQKFVMVRRHGSASRVPARVLAVGHDCDLALLGIENDDADEFFLHSRSLQFSDDIPRLEDEVSVIGYPTGGDNISITRGVVSRVEPQQYAHGVTTLLSIQIDAAINPGNSGGPALEGGKVVGVAFQNLSGAENIGFVIPVPIIKRFISDVDRNQGNYKGFCSLGMLCQSLENSQLRSFKQLAAQQTGVLVSKVSKVSSADGIVLPGDVILSAEGHTLASDGSILFRDRERIPFDWLLSSKHAGDMFSLKVLRNGQEISLEVPLKIASSLVPAQQFDIIPKYFIFAGLVFIRLTQPYLHEWGDEWYNVAPRKLCDRALNGEIEVPGQEIVVLSSVLADATNLGYNECVNQVLVEVNGSKVHNLAHLRALVEAVTEGTVRFLFEDQRICVVDALTARNALPKLLEKHRIPAAVSL